MASTKLKTFKLLEILYKETDANNRLKTGELIEKLAEQGIKCDRRSIYDDIELFRELGFDVKKNVGYYIDKRQFTLEEVKILVDSISAVEYLPTTVSETIKEKLIYGLGKTDRTIVNDQFFVNYANDKLLKGYDLIGLIRSLTLAIYNKRSLQIITEKDGKKHAHLLSPYMLVLNNQHYYLIAFNHHTKEVYHYRLDRIKGINYSRYGYISPDSISDYGCFVDVVDYKIHTYNMYSGELAEVSVCFHSGIYEYMKNHFEDAEFKPVGNGMFRCKINVNVSDGFYQFVLSYGDKIQVLEPKEVADEVKRRALEIAKMYE